MPIANADLFVRRDINYIHAQCTRAIPCNYVYGGEPQDSNGIHLKHSEEPKVDLN